MTTDLSARSSYSRAHIPRAAALMQAGSATLAIIGGGFSGTVLAANLLRRPPATPTRILLFERRARIGCGLAYAPSEHPFLLNVPAARMSASSYEPAHLIDYARRRLPLVDDESYVTREFYGEYLFDFLQAAELGAPLHVRLERIHGEVIALRPQGAGEPIQVQLADQMWLADRVVLACGDPPSASRPYSLEVTQLPNYVRNPYDRDSIQPADRSVLLIGTGLTMVDVAVAAAARIPTLRITALSRHGRLPMAQTPQTYRPVLEARTELCGLDSSCTIAQALTALRRLMLLVQERGGDWREAITRARDCAPHVWQNLPESERRRFLRHVRVYWDTHRHRMPPAFATRVTEMCRDGQLSVQAGRILRLQANGHGITVHWRPRGHSELKHQLFDRVIDCSGADRRLECTPDPLWRQLLDAGLAQPDEVGLGLRTGPLGELTDAGGRPSERIFYLGPMLRARYWEATAVAELRHRAEALAAAIAGRAPKSVPAETDAA